MVENEALRKNRFSKDRPGSRHTKKHPNGYFMPLLKQLLEKKVPVDDPKVRKLLGATKSGKATLKQLVILRHIQNATEGEHNSIKDMIDRFDGKVTDKVEHSMDDETKSLLNKAMERMNG